MELGRQPKQTVSEKAPTNQLSCNCVWFWFKFLAEGSMCVCGGGHACAQGWGQGQFLNCRVVWGVLWKPRGMCSWFASLQSEQWNHWISQTTACSDVQFRLFIQNLHSWDSVRYPQPTVCESLLELLIIYRWSHKAVPCYVTDTDSDGCIHIIAYISASLELDKSETGRCNILEV